MEKRHYDILHDLDRTVLLAAFFNPYTCKLLITYEPAPTGSDPATYRPQLTAASMRLLNGDANQKGIVAALAEDVPAAYAAVGKSIFTGIVTESKLQRDIGDYLDAVRTEQLPTLPGADFTRIAATSHIYTRFESIRVGTLSYGGARPASSDPETAFSLMALLLTALRNRLGWRMHAALTYLTADARALRPRTRTVNYIDRVTLAVLCMGGMSRVRALRQVAETATAARAAAAPSAAGAGAATSACVPPIASVSAAAAAAPAAAPAPAPVEEEEEEEDEGAVQLALLTAGNFTLVDDDGNFNIDDALELLEAREMATSPSVDDDVVDALFVDGPLRFRESRGFDEPLGGAAASAADSGGGGGSSSAPNSTAATVAAARGALSKRPREAEATGGASGAAAGATQPAKRGRGPNRSRGRGRGAAPSRGGSRGRGRGGRGGAVALSGGDSDDVDSGLPDGSDEAEVNEKE